MDIGINKSGFSQVQSKQQAVINDLEALYNEQKAVFDELANTWKGAGGDSFG